MSDSYLAQILVREAVPVGPSSPALAAANRLLPVLRTWGNGYLMSALPSGSYAKGTANRSGTDIDLFLSVSETLSDNLAMKEAGYKPKRQNVSINVNVNGWDVDLVPGKRQNAWSTDHSLYRRKADAWTKTNIDTHIATVRTSGRSAAIRVLKLWRNQWGLDFPSFYLELTTIKALGGTNLTLSHQVAHALSYLKDSFENARVVDPANTSNIISDDLTKKEKKAISDAAERALAMKWEQLVR
jgi:Nucleotidyltransferase domain